MSIFLFHLKTTSAERIYTILKILSNLYSSGKFRSNLSLVKSIVPGGSEMLYTKLGFGWPNFNSEFLKNQCDLRRSIEEWT